MLNEVLRLTNGNPSSKQQQKDKAPIYEYEYALIYNHSIITTTDEHLTAEESKSLVKTYGEWYKILETQRERRSIDE
jgi:hypothetical protein